LVYHTFDLQIFINQKKTKMGTTARSKRNTSVSNRQNRQNNRRTSSVSSLENGIRIMKYAIKRRTSLSAASNADGRGKNYISDIKARLEENYKSKNISRDLYTTFKSLNKQYQSAVK
jgi:hypothetical protein